MIRRFSILITLFLAACTSTNDIKLPVTTSSEKALELYNEAIEFSDKWEGREAQQKFAAALRIDPNFILANLYAGSEDPAIVRQYRTRALENKSNGSESEEIKVDILIKSDEL